MIIASICGHTKGQRKDNVMRFHYKAISLSHEYMLDSFGLGLKHTVINLKIKSATANICS